MSIYLLGHTGNIYAQVNLVPNPSFEVYDTCPSYYAPTYRSIYNAIPWFQPYTPLNSTDYFNSCAIDTVLSLSTPNNYEGYQLPHFGDAYAGFTTGYISPQNNLREYLEVELIDTLEFGLEYCVSFYINFANKSKTSTDGIGAYLSSNMITYNSPPQFHVLAFIPQIINASNNIISDTLYWTKISSEFISSGGEKFLTIGNFKDDAHTSYIRNNYGIHAYSYYYIDDVSVVLGNCTVGINDHNAVSNISISPNPVKDIFTLNNLPIETASIFVYNLQGKILLKQEFTTSDKSVKQVNVSALSAGIYFVKVVTEKGTVARKFLKE